LGLVISSKRLKHQSGLELPLCCGAHQEFDLYSVVWNHLE
jgi:hypothetical protein